MAFCPIAYGAKGLIYFMYEGTSDSSFDYITDFTNPNLPTQKYNEVKNMNYFIENIIGPIVMNNRWIGAFHKSNSPTGESELFSGGALSDDLLSSPRNTVVYDVNNPEVLFGIFKSDSIFFKYCINNYNDLTGAGNLTICSDTMNEYYIWVVNKNVDSPVPSTYPHTSNYNKINIDLYGWNWDSIWAAPRVGSLAPNDTRPYNGSILYTPLSKSQTSNGLANVTRFSLDSLDPGEGRLFKARLVKLKSTKSNKIK